MMKIQLGNSLKRSARRVRGFTLLELMVSMSVLSIIMLLVFQMLGSTQRAWSASRARLSTFKEARVAFEGITRRLSQATLNTYYAYEYQGSIPRAYKKESELHFVCAGAGDLLGTESRYPGHAVFFQAPVGFSLEKENQPLTHLLNAWGYFVEYGDAQEFTPDFLNVTGGGKSRYRLMEFRPPAEALKVYDLDLKNASGGQVDAWFAAELEGTSGNGTKFVRPIADNVLMLIIEPKESNSAGQSNTTNALAPDYVYDSRAKQTRRGKATDETLHVLPPILDVTMVAIDEESAIRYEQVNGSLETLELTGLFKTTGSYRQDLITLGKRLTDARIDYRVFHDTVAIKASTFNAGVTIR